MLQLAMGARHNLGVTDMGKAEDLHGGRVASAVAVAYTGSGSWVFLKQQVLVNHVRSSPGTSPSLAQYDAVEGR